MMNRLWTKLFAILVFSISGGSDCLAQVGPNATGYDAFGQGFGSTGQSRVSPASMGYDSRRPGNMAHGNMGHGNMTQGNLSHANMGHGNMGQGFHTQGPMGDAPIGQGVAGSGSMSNAISPMSDNLASESYMAPAQEGIVQWRQVPLFQSSDHAFDSFISPISNLIYFEDPRALTEIRPFFLHHNVPQDAGGGSVQLYGAQVRMRLTDRVSLIMTKNGYGTTSNSILADGWADIAAGLKFTIFKNEEKQYILSTGLTYELPSGDSAFFQGNGDGVFNWFMAGAQKITQRINWMAASGVRVPVNSTDESTSSYWSNHFDYQVTNRFYLLTEFNWYHWMKSGQDGPLPGIEGLDIINFGNTDISGNDIVTGAFGFKYKFSSQSEAGVAWEVPLTQRRDILDNRLTIDWRLRY